MERRKFFTAISSLPFLGFLKPGEPTKIPGLERVRVEAVEACATGAHLEYGDDEPVLNVWMGDNPAAVELIWCWKSNGNKYRAYTLLVHPEYAKRMGSAMGMKKGSLVVDELEISKVLVDSGGWKTAEVYYKKSV